MERYERVKMAGTGLVRYSRWAWRLLTLNSQKKPFPSASSSSSFAAATFSTTPEHENPGRPGPPPIRVALTESSGRGVFATRKIETGELLHTAKPILSHPSLSTVQRVCYFCLRKLKNTDSSQPQRVSYCSEECQQQAKVDFFFWFLWVSFKVWGMPTNCLSFCFWKKCLVELPLLLGSALTYNLLVFSWFVGISWYWDESRLVSLWGLLPVCLLPSFQSFVSREKSSVSCHSIAMSLMGSLLNFVSPKMIKTLPIVMTPICSLFCVWVL